MANPQTSIRLPKSVKEQLEALCIHLGMTKTQVLIVAVERLAKQELKKHER